jgi:uncharacterized phage-associated protein
MLTAEQVADYLLLKANMNEEGEFLSNMKLQKLLYYCQGFHLAETGKQLFKEPIKAWTYGPVVENIYHKYKSYGWSSITPPEELDLLQFTDYEIQLMDDVYNLYGQFSAWKLRDMTHEEPPWKDTPQNKVISNDKLRSYFQTQLIED